MTYSVKEIFYTLQGEGARTGRPAVFCRFAGCNLWSGLEEDRASAVCRFCDTEFVGTDGSCGGKYRTADALAKRISSLWPDDAPMARPYVVCTGGEPLLQLDSALVEALHRAGFEVAVETNGTCEAPPGIDWICVSPKAGADLVLRKGHELKLVYPQQNLDPKTVSGLAFDCFYLQPMDGPDLADNIRQTVEYCLCNPQWRLSFQTHKAVWIR